MQPSTRDTAAFAEMRHAMEHAAGVVADGRELFDG